MAISFAWTMPALEWNGITPEIMPVLEPNLLGADIEDPEFAAALAMVYRNQEGGFLAQTPYRHMANRHPNSTGEYWIHIDHTDPGCASSWEPLPGRAESLVALQRWSLRIITMQTFLGKYVTGLVGVHMATQDGLPPELRTEVFPVGEIDSVEDFIELALLNLSATYRTRKRVSAAAGLQLGYFKEGRDFHLGDRPWAEFDRFA